MTKELNEFITKLENEKSPTEFYFNWKAPIIKKLKELGGIKPIKKSGKEVKKDGTN